MPWLPRAALPAAHAVRSCSDSSSSSTKSCSSISRCRRARTSGWAWRPSAAQALARREFGSLTQHKDDYRDRWGARHLETIAQDIRTGARHAWSQPGTSLAIVLALALGVGVSTAVFSVFNGVLLQPLPFADAGSARPAAGRRAASGERLFSAPEVRDLRAEAHEPRRRRRVPLHVFHPARSAGAAARLGGRRVGEFLRRDRRARRARARLHARRKNSAGAPGVIMLSHRFWHQELRRRSRRRRPCRSR